MMKIGYEPYFGYFTFWGFLGVGFSVVSQGDKNWNIYSGISLGLSIQVFHLVCQFGHFTPVPIRVFDPFPKLDHLRNKNYLFTPTYYFRSNPTLQLTNYLFWFQKTR